MKLYEIDRELETLLSNVDEETGELLIDPEAIDALLMAKEDKIEGIALWIKDLRAEAAMVKSEKEALAKRQQVLENKADRTAAFLQRYLNGEKFKTPKVTVSYRSSKKTEITDEVAFWKWSQEHTDFVTFKAPEPNKTAIKAALNEGETIPGCQLVENISMQIK